jgi:hypothetical protein
LHRSIALLPLSALFAIRTYCPQMCRCQHHLEGTLVLEISAIASRFISAVTSGGGVSGMFSSERLIAIVTFFLLVQILCVEKATGPTPKHACRYNRSRCRNHSRQLHYRRRSLSLSHGPTAHLLLPSHLLSVPVHIRQRQMKCHAAGAQESHNLMLLFGRK